MYLEAEQVERLRERAQATGIPMAVLIRKGVDRVLAGFALEEMAQRASIPRGDE